MRLLINLLSVGHMSGRHVVYGFLRQLARWTQGDHQLILLHYHGSPPPEDLSGPHLQCVAISDRLRHWAIRSAWESCRLPRWIYRQRIDMVFTASGAITPGLIVPQISLAQNPWCFIPKTQRTTLDRVKAHVQRRAYRSAFHRARMMFFLSDHLRSLYRRHAIAGRETQTEVAWVALDDATHQAAERMRAEVAKQPRVILCVSAMAKWKGVETLVTALERLHARGLNAQLRLVGPWPDPIYQQQIRRQISQAGLEGAVTVTGHVSRAELDRHYAEARVYSLMSYCESFGIPAAEAMAFGTPVVASQDCAISEVCAGAGLFGPAGNPDWTADALEQLLTNQATWDQLSGQAIQNAAQLRWEICSRPLMKMFERGE